MSIYPSGGEKPALRKSFDFRHLQQMCGIWVQMGWFTRNSRPTCTSKVSELAEGIKALKAANNVEAAPQRIGQRQSSAKKARVIPPRKSTASQSTSLIKPQVSSLPAVYRAVTADGP